MRSRLFERPRLSVIEIQDGCTLKPPFFFGLTDLPILRGPLRPTAGDVEAGRPSHGESVQVFHQQLARPMLYDHARRPLCRSHLGRKRCCDVFSCVLAMLREPRLDQLLLGSNCFARSWQETG